MRQCSRRRHASVGKLAFCRRLVYADVWRALYIALTTLSCTFSKPLNRPGDAPDQTAEQYSKRGRINCNKVAQSAVYKLFERKKNTLCTTGDQVTSRECRRLKQILSALMGMG